MTKEYMVMMKVRGKWWPAHVSTRKAQVSETYEDAKKELKYVEEGRIRYGCPADEYKIMCRDVTEWIDV